MSTSSPKVWQLSRWQQIVRENEQQIKQLHQELDSVRLQSRRNAKNATVNRGLWQSTLKSANQEHDAIKKSLQSLQDDIQAHNAADDNTFGDLRDDIEQLQLDIQAHDAADENTFRDLRRNIEQLKMLSVELQAHIQAIEQKVSEQKVSIDTSDDDDPQGWQAQQRARGISYPPTYERTKLKF